MKEEVISLEDIFHSLKRRWKMIVLITILSAVVAGVYSYYTIKPAYQGSVKVFIGKEGTTPETKSYNSGDIALYQKLMKTYMEVIKTKDSVESALNSIGKDTGAGNVSRVLSGLSVSSNEDTQILYIGYKTGNKEEITEILAAVTNTFMAKSKELIPNSNIQIIQKAEEPTMPLPSNEKKNIVLGLLVGLMVSVGIAFLLEYLDNTFKKAENLEEELGVPVLAVIPDFNEKIKKRKSKNKSKEPLKFRRKSR